MSGKKKVKETPLNMKLPKVVCNHCVKEFTPESDYHPMRQRLGLKEYFISLCPKCLTIMRPSNYQDHGTPKKEVTKDEGPETN